MNPANYLLLTQKRSKVGVFDYVEISDFLEVSAKFASIRGKYICM